MATLDRLIQVANIRRAWRWVQSNPSPAYKNYFRTLYSKYATAEGKLLDELYDRLKRGVYHPAHACKIYLPKSSGGLRPFTLLTVEDQIVYQAYVNILAEQFVPQARKQYMSEVFSHMYAGCLSPFFYRKWKVGYAGFNRAARQAYRDGLRYTARFDLTACYDSLDHNVLEFFLDDLGCDREFCRKFRALLSHWTSTGLNPRRIYQGHGIPQGPLSSGLVAEVILQHFDQHRRRWPGVRYLRYVDDIRLFAKSELEVRTAVYDLDLLSKEIGLFPQSSKIAIHEVADIEDELKSLSRPDEDDFDWEDAANRQDQVHGLLAELSPRFRVQDATRFKALLASAKPRAATNGRLWKVLRHHPEMYGNILAYFQRYNRLPAKDREELIEELMAEDTHGVKITELIRTAEGRLTDEAYVKIDAIVKKHWKNRIKLSVDLVAMLGVWSMKRGLLNTKQVEEAVTTLPGWYTRAELVAALDTRSLPQPGLNNLLFSRLNDEVSDVAIAAAAHLGLQETNVDSHTPMHVAAGPVLSAFDVLSGGPQRACGITQAFERLLGKKPPGVNWKNVLGQTYRRAEIQAVRWSGYLTDATAWVNAMDVFCDWLLDALYRIDTTLGNYSLGKIGSVLTRGGRLDSTYPKLFRLVHDIHGKRGESDLSHPKQRRGSSYLKPTSFIRFQYFKTARKLATEALLELASRWPLRVASRKSK